MSGGRAEAGLARRPRGERTPPEVREAVLALVRGGESIAKADWSR